LSDRNACTGGLTRLAALGTLSCGALRERGDATHRAGGSTTPVEAELRIADQHFGAAKDGDTAINARGDRVGSGELGGDIVGHAVLRVVKPAAGPVARTVGLQTPNDRETAEVPLPQ